MPPICKITFDHNYWFDNVTKNLPDSAEVTDVNGNSIIVINEIENVLIYNLILSRIAETTKVVFQ